MAKPKSRYVCQACGSVSSRWQGQCADCDEWNTLIQEAEDVPNIFAAKHNLQGGGKSTLLLQVAARLANEGRKVVYVAGEESAEQVRLRAVRLGLGGAPVRLAAATSVRDILTTMSGGEPPALLIIDSIQ